MHRTWARHLLIFVALACGGAALADDDWRDRDDRDAGVPTSVRCESNDGRENFCPFPNDGDLRLDRTLSRAQCVQGQTWRADRRGVYVRNGCRAEFVRERRYDDGWGVPGNGWGQAESADVACRSRSGRESFCAVENRGIELRRTESSAPCIEGQTWRYDARGIYVRGGCRGIFHVRRGTSWDDGGNAVYGVSCSSSSHRWSVCPVDIGRGVRLAKQESHAACVRGQTWGTIGREAIWVSNGCRARFDVYGGRPASNRAAASGIGDAPPGADRSRAE